MTHLKTAIILDQAGSFLSLPEEEIETHKEDFSALLTPAVLDVYTPYSCYPEDIQCGTDLLLFDYGGMLLGNSMAEKNSWYLVQYAQDNPNALIVVVSSFTWSNLIERELESRDMLEVHNVVSRWGENSDDPIPKWFRDMHKLPYIDPYASPKKLKTPGRVKASE